MTNKERAFEMRAQGKKHREIAAELGITKQAVAQYFTGVYAKRKKQTVVTEKGCKYKGLRDWLNNRYMSLTELLQLMGYEYSPKSCSNLRYALTYSESGLRMKDVKRILQVTGMTFEECFGEEG